VAGYGRDVTDLVLDEIAPPVEDDTDRPLEDLNLSMRTANALKRANINSISQVLALSDNDLLGLRNFGQKSLDELRAALVDHGYASPFDAESATEEEPEGEAAPEPEEE
jgi:DNA-directed RNA polymerase subunit alpha